MNNQLYVETATPTIPPPRPVQWALRPRESADVSYTEGTSVRVRIDHAPLPGVTPAMLEWWYGHVPGVMEYAGAVYPRYQVWHPLDHISYDVLGDFATQRDGVTPMVATGSRLHIREALHRDPEQLLDIRVTVEELGPGRAVIAKRVLGTNIVRLENDFDEGVDGATYRTTLTVGDDTLLGRLVLNLVARRRAFPPDRIEAWIRHHIEEIGNLEHFLPDLHAAQAET